MYILMDVYTCGRNINVNIGFNYAPMEIVEDVGKLNLEILSFRMFKFGVA